jgi:uncharacterized repeat protein (TIGR01451 family)
MASFWKLASFNVAALLAVVTMPAQAAPGGVALTSDARIERTETGADGAERTVLKSPAEVIVVPGDRVVFTLKYRNGGTDEAKGFRATNPMPAPVQFVSAAEEWAEVSVDGGKIWGKLATMTVQSTAPDGTSVTRAAGPEDVTHVRWVFATPIAPGSEGSLSYRGIIK